MQMKKIVFMAVSLLFILFYVGTLLAGNIEEITKKAKAGDAAAQFNLGVCYLNETGLEKNYKKAKEWLEKAHGNGYPEEEIKKIWDEYELWKY